MSVPPLYTPVEAAELLKVPESWLRKKAAARHIPCTFVGKHLRFSEDDVQQIVRSGERKPAGTAPRTLPPHRRSDRASNQQPGRNQGEVPTRGRNAD